MDQRRVGMFGTSYGGTVSATCLLRYPDVFQAACANSAVTDYRNYDTIYAERYMWIPQENKAGYDAASVMSYATNLQGRLMIFYGTADNNVHPANTPAAHPGAAAGRQELRGAGRPGPGPHRRQPRPHDGVLHREPGPGQTARETPCPRSGFCRESREETVGLSACGEGYLGSSGRFLAGNPNGSAVQRKMSKLQGNRFRIAGHLSLTKLEEIRPILQQIA